MKNYCCEQLVILKIASIILAVGIIYLNIWTNIFGNTWGLITGQGFIILTESSIVNFEVTMMNDGSGEWWLYGEDNNYCNAERQREGILCDTKK